MEVTGLAQSLPGNPPVQAQGGDFSALGSTEFFKLIITDLLNQDPLNPTDNQKLLEQISLIRDIEMRMENDTLRIRFEAERPEVGELLKNNSAALSNALAEQGISVERYEVVLSEAASEPDEFGQHLEGHDGPQDSSSEPDARRAAEGSDESDRSDGEVEQVEEEGAPAGGAERRLDIKA